MVLVKQCRVDSRSRGRETHPSNAKIVKKRRRIQQKQKKYKNMNVLRKLRKKFKN